VEAGARKAKRNAQRDTETITEDMKEEVMDMLRCFGLPYMVAPFEAEAQCARLEELGLVDGVVTEDSDTFLFGAKAVYKNMFEDRKNVEVCPRRARPAPAPLFLPFFPFLPLFRLTSF
jgi:DNA excision repair protein ERCC-5